MKAYYAALDSVQKQHEIGPRRLDDGTYVYYLFAFAGVRDVPSAERIVKAWRAQSKRPPRTAGIKDAAVHMSDMKDVLQRAEDWIRARMNESGVDRLEAICHMQSWRPELHAAFMEEHHDKPIESWQSFR